MYEEQLTFFQKQSEAKSILNDMTFRLEKWSNKLPTDKSGNFIASEDFNTFKKRVHEIDVLETFANYTETLIKELFILVDASNNFIELNNRVKQTKIQHNETEYNTNTKFASQSKFTRDNRWRYQNLTPDEYNDYVINNHNPDKFDF